MAFRPLHATLAGLTAALVLTACGHGAAPLAPEGRGTAAFQAAEADREMVKPSSVLGRTKIDSPALELTPEGAEEEARARASAWQADAELRFVGWGVLKFQLLSAVTHVFYSPSADEVLVVKTFLRDKWQDADAYDHQLVVKPASILQPLSRYNVTGARAMKLSRKYYPGFFRRPISLVTLSHPKKLPFAFWGVIADRTVVLVHANTGQSLSPRGFDPFPKEWTK